MTAPDWVSTLTGPTILSGSTEIGRNPNLAFSGFDISTNRGTKTTTISAPTPLTTTSDLNFPNIPQGGASELDISLSGVELGDAVIVNPTALGLELGVVVTAYVSGSNVVRVRCSNVTTGSVNPANMNYRITAWKH